jgi:hypothetical protein
LFCTFFTINIYLGFANIAMSIPNDLNNISVPNYATSSPAASTGNMAGFLGVFGSGMLGSDSNTGSQEQMFHGAGTIVDPNSPEVFKGNILLVKEMVMRVQNLANGALIGMWVAQRIPRYGSRFDPANDASLIYCFYLTHRYRLAMDSQNAYASGNNPAQISADLANLKQALELLCERMTQTGVGALPLLPSSASAAGEQAGTNFSSSMTESELLETTTRSVEALFAELKRRQETAFNIGNLLASSRT